jgi:hypothetical protein
MAGEIRLQSLTGIADVKGAIYDQNGQVWDSANMVGIDTLDDAEWAAGLVACAEEQTDDATGTGLYLGDKPGALADGIYSIVFYSGASPAPDDAYIGTQDDFLEYLTAAVDALNDFDPASDTVARVTLTDTTTDVTNPVTLASSEDVYHADIDVSIDGANNQDEYTITWFKNGVRVTSGITSPTIQVIKRSNGSDLIAETTPTQIGSIGSYKEDEGTNRITAGEAVVVVVGATIDGSPRTFARVVSRDSE